MEDQYEACLREIQRIVNDPSAVIDAELSPRQREIYRVYASNDMNLYGVALELGLSRITVRNQITEAIRKGAPRPTKLGSFALRKIKELVDGVLESS